MLLLFFSQTGVVTPPADEEVVAGGSSWGQRRRRLVRPTPEPITGSAVAIAQGYATALGSQRVLGRARAPLPAAIGRGAGDVVYDLDETLEVLTFTLEAIES